MIVPVKLKPFLEWPGACRACRTSGYETIFTERQAERYSGMWVEIDSARPCTASAASPGRAWHATRETGERLTGLIFPGAAIPEEKADQLIVCEHMIEPRTLFIGKMLGFLHRIGIMKRFPCNKAIPVDQEPLVGSLFLAIAQCRNCEALKVYGRGEVLERIPGADAYILQPYVFGPKFIRQEFVSRVQGYEMAYWRFYQSIPEMLRAQQEIEQEGKHHAPHVHVN